MLVRLPYETVTGLVLRHGNLAVLVLSSMSRSKSQDGVKK